MNKKIRRMIKEIERRGGMIGVDGSLPDEVAERFLQDVLSCPDCFAHGQGDTDRVRDPDTGIYGLHNARISRRPKGH
jgi:hypothetical protein